MDDDCCGTVIVVEDNQETTCLSAKGIMNIEKPFSAACERNREPILEVLKRFITRDDKRLLEVGTGTGQHAVYFAPHFPWLEWFPTDVQTNLSGMKLWFDEFNIPNIQKPQRMEVGKDELPKLKFEIIFTSNTFHIMHWKECKSLMKMFGGRLREGARVVIYGPFKYDGQFTSESNGEFDQSLKLDDPMRGIRSFEDVKNNMEKNGFELTEDVDMPANNQMLVFTRLKHRS
jgi:cyclopropane fatty-acyl-phospholipid synthase-like methyltransferase